MLKKVITLTIISLFFVSCKGTSEIKSILSDEFEISYIESYVMSSPALVRNNMEEEIKKVCASGYEKLSEKVHYKSSMPTHIWRFKCL